MDTTVRFIDCVSSYRVGDGGGQFGMRLADDRRFWMAWQDGSFNSGTDIYRGVMDDFGTLVETRHLCGR